MTTEEKRKQLDAAGYMFRITSNPIRKLNNFVTPDMMVWCADWEDLYTPNFEREQLEMLVDKAWQHYQKEQYIIRLEKMIHTSISYRDVCSGKYEKLYNEINEKYG